MHRLSIRFVAFGLLAAFFLFGAVGISSAAAAEPAKKEPFRMPASGVMSEVKPQRQVDETFSRHDLTELEVVDPDLDWAKGVVFRHDIWTLRFDYKPLRMIWIDVPQKSGKAQRKPIYYLVYRVTNVPIADQADQSKYGWMHPVAQKDGSYQVAFQDRPIRFIPELVLESPEFKKAYPDRVIPLAMGPIREREDRRLPNWVDSKKTVPRCPLRNSVEMTGDIKPGESVWGVAMWEDLDPRIDKIDIYVQGLTNAYRWKDDPAKFKPGQKRDEYREKFLKTLRLHFWQPGDQYEQDETELRMGYPGSPDHDWLYLPQF